MLGSMFGEWGQLIIQFLVTVGVVLALIALIYWLVRRYSSGGLGRIGRGRVPRLAIVDAMPVDGRRRLVLVRRDNIEHLILIGGPSDLVVEQSIQRPRRPTAKPTAEAAPASPVAVPAATENQPIPFPQSRVHQTAGQAAGDRPFFPARRTAAPQPAARSEPARIEQASAAVQFQEMPEEVAQEVAETEPLFPEMPEADLPLPTEQPAEAAPPPEATNGHQPHLSFEPPPTPNPFAIPTPTADEETAAKVNDLEREMARLLGEITQQRPA